MEYLQVSDAWLRRAMAEYQAVHPAPVFGVQENAANVVFRLVDEKFTLFAGGFEIESYALPLRLPALMNDLVWFFTERVERANREIKLGDDYSLHPHEFRLSAGTLSVQLTGREIAMLQFMAKAGECTKETLLSEVWRYHPESDTHTVETHLWRLRQKLQQAGMTQPLIITTDKGYRLA
jgi:DNA-binding response OmpR family regulator